MNFSRKSVTFCTLVIAAVVLLLASCSKSDSAGGGESSTALVQVSLTGASYEAAQTIEHNRAATPVASTIQRNTIEVNKDFLMVAELRPEEPESSLKDGAKAAIETTNIDNDIQYRVLVYDQSEAFVTERDYIRGQESNTPALLLDAGSTYTFVVLSLNRTTVIPETLPTNTSARTLLNSYVNVTDGSTGLMYFKQTMTLSGNSINRLDIILKHRKAAIRVRINSSQTGYNVTAVTANFQPHNSAMLVNLHDGAHILTGIASASPVTYGTGGAFNPSQNVISTSSNFINAINNNLTFLTINSLTIGTITATNLIPFTNLTVTAGVRYELILNIVPTDGYLTHQDQLAARINGQIWMRHNLGANYTVDPDEASFNRLVGDFFQWGRRAIAANGATATGAISGWNNSSTNLLANRWNLGTEALPIKNTVNDPCPTGYRVPTMAEMTALLAATNASNTGDFTTRSQLNTAKILTSARNVNVKLTFPMGGARNYNNGAEESRPASGFYWNSAAVGNDARHFGFNQNAENMGQSLKSWGLNIKCIAI